MIYNRIFSMTYIIVRLLIETKIVGNHCRKLKDQFQFQRLVKKQ